MTVSTVPPNPTVPPLPIAKSRKSLPVASDAIYGAAVSYMPSRATSQSAPGSAIPLANGQLPHTASTPAVPTLRSISSLPRHDFSVSEKGPRRSISIGAFPRPPKTGVRLPSTIIRPSIVMSRTETLLEGNQEESSALNSPVPAVDGARSKKLRNLNHALGKLTTSPATSNSTSGQCDDKSLFASQAARSSAGIISITSPSHSRSSSAQGSYSTSATTFEDVDESHRKGREEDGDGVGIGIGRKRSTRTEVKGNVIVSVRVRPDPSTVDRSKSEGEWLIDGRQSLVAFRGREGGDYYYDNVFAIHDKNDKVYDGSTKRLVRRVMEGYHGTVFAYGMTGTGKTFSMQGTADSPGVIPLAITDIFSYIRETPHREFLLRVSYLEIYNEKIYDLLSSPPTAGTGFGASQQEEIKLREDNKRGVYAWPLEEEIVQSPTQLLRVIARGDHVRRTSSTQYNSRSSRSHAVVQIVVESRERMQSGSFKAGKRTPLGPGGVRVSTLSLIDLAGSERAAESKERRTEGAHINKSLLTLGTVIARLSGDKDKNGNPTDKDGKHLPYRDSKLTRLLQPALSGDSLVSILCTIQVGSAGGAAAANGHRSETLNTLKFASRAKNNIVSHAKRAEEQLGGGSDAGSRILLERYRMEIQNLRGQLEDQVRDQRDQEEKQLAKEADKRREEQLLEMQFARTALKERIEHLNRLIISSKSLGVNTNRSFSSLSIHPKLSAYVDGETNAQSILPSQGHSVRETATPSLNRTASVGSTVTLGGHVGSGQSPSSSFDVECEEAGSRDGSGVSTASLGAQNRALQADLADKKRYISTLEKRLLQARRSSHSRTSLVFSPASKVSGVSGDDSPLADLLQEKDAEIADLRSRLDDKDRMVTALRSAARKRDIADCTPEPSESLSEKPPKHPTKDSISGVGGRVLPKSPVELLLPQKVRDEERAKQRKSVDEMSRILDEMIQDRVESGQLVKGMRGSVRLAQERSDSRVLAEELSPSIPGN